MTISATFTWYPGYAPELVEEPKVLVAKFGDGYEQRAADGINANPQTWALSFNNVSNSTADDIVGFLRDHAGRVAFNWTPPRASSAIVVVCRSWRRQVAGPSWNVIQATFEQVPEPTAT